MQSSFSLYVMQSRNEKLNYNHRFYRRIRATRDNPLGRDASRRVCSSTYLHKTAVALKATEPEKQAPSYIDNGPE